MIKVYIPLSVDAQFKLNLGGGVEIPMRALLTAGVLGIPAFLVAFKLHGDFLPHMAFATVIAIVGGMAGLLPQEGIWLGTFAFYRMIERMLPRMVRNGEVLAGLIKTIKGATGDVSMERRAATSPLSLPSPFDRWVRLPRVRMNNLQDGLFERTPGGWCAILAVEGPATAPTTKWYAQWCENFIHWIAGVECPAQIYCEATNHDRAEAENAFDSKVDHRQTNLVYLERLMAGDVAARTLIVNTYVIFTPGTAGADGIPHTASPTKMVALADTTKASAEKYLDTALRLGASANLKLRPASAEEIRNLLANSVIGAQNVTNSNGLTVSDGSFQGVVASSSALPPVSFFGAIIMSVMESRMRGVMSMHFYPVSAQTATKFLKSQRANYRFMLRHNPDDIEAGTLLSQMDQLHQEVVSRTSSVCRIALGFRIMSDHQKTCDETIEVLRSRLQERGVRTHRITAPGLVPDIATSPGGAPLTRSLLLTTYQAAAAMLPAVGTPFSDHTQPLWGENGATGGPVYLDVYKRRNHNAVIVGTSGAGKSVACKTVLIRHVLQGARAVIIDPDSEYEMVVKALGGSYVELGESSLNAFGVGAGVTPDEAAEWVVPLLSVMGGAETGYQDGRPVRRLSDADKAWLHTEVSNFFNEWREESADQEPILGDFIHYLETEGMMRAQAMPGRLERLQDINLRLKGYTQGKKASIFNRKTQFDMNSKVTAVGLSVLALQFRADLTPALAFCLATILGIMAQKKEKLIILVDEAHRVTSDPDAAEVLDQVIRQARKYGGGVWMASQSVDDFLNTSLGRTLATNAGTKLILGIDETVADKAREVFGLTEQELAGITPPPAAGQGILISAEERVIVRILPGPHIIEIASTSFLPQAS